MMKQNTYKGFTIVELLIVIVVIGILAAITIVAYNGIQERARFTTAKSDLASVNKAILMYHAENGKYPGPTSGQAGCTNGWCGWGQVTGDAFIDGLSPEYIQTIPQKDQSIASNSDTYLYTSDTTSYRLMRYSTGLPSIELTDNPLLATPQFSTTGWGYKSANINWGGVAI